MGKSVRRKDESSSIVWHYTIGRNFPVIAQHGLRPTTEVVDDSERAAVWFTTKSSWEETANRLYRVGETREAVPLNRDETELVGRGLFRFGVDRSLAPNTWPEHRRYGRISDAMASFLERIATENGSDPSDWRLAYHTIAWSSVERTDLWYRGAWTPLDRATPAKFGRYLIKRDEVCGASLRERLFGRSEQ